MPAVLIDIDIDDFRNPSIIEGYYDKFRYLSSEFEYVLILMESHQAYHNELNDIRMTDWYSDIPNELLQFLLDIQDRIISVTICFNPITKHFFNINPKTSGSQNLDKLFIILNNAINIRSFAIKIRSYHSFITHYNEYDGMRYFCKWIDFIFCKRTNCINSLSKIENLEIFIQIHFKDKKKLKFKNLINFIKNHKSLKRIEIKYIASELTLNDDASHYDITTFWFPILNAIKYNKSIQHLSIFSVSQTDTKCFNDDPQFDHFDDPLNLYSTKLKINDSFMVYYYCLVLRKIAEILSDKKEIHKIDICPINFGNTQKSNIGITELLNKIINDDNINDISINISMCKDIEHFIFFKEVFSKYHINALSLKLPELLIENDEDIMNLFKNITICSFELSQIVITPSLFNIFLGNILSQNVYLNDVQLFVTFLPDTKPSDSFYKILFENIIKSIKRNKEILDDYIASIHELFEIQCKLHKNIGDIIINDYLLFDILHEFQIHIEIDLDYYQYILVKKHYNLIGKMMKHFQKYFVNKQQNRKITLQIQFAPSRDLQDPIQFNIPYNIY